MSENSFIKLTDANFAILDDGSYRPITSVSRMSFDKLVGNDSEGETIRADIPTITYTFYGKSIVDDLLSLLSVFNSTHWIKKLTAKFLHQHPKEEYGGAHIVLSDDNYDTESIEHCLNQDYLPIAPETRRYLEWLLTIPEIFRHPYIYSDEYESDIHPSSPLDPAYR